MFPAVGRPGLWHFCPPPGGWVWGGSGYTFLPPLGPPSLAKVQCGCAQGRWKTAGPQERPGPDSTSFGQRVETTLDAFL